MSEKVLVEKTTYNCSISLWKSTQDNEPVSLLLRHVDDEDDEYWIEIPLEEVNDFVKLLLKLKSQVLGEKP